MADCTASKFRLEELEKCTQKAKVISWVSGVLEGCYSRLSEGCTDNKWLESHRLLNSPKIDAELQGLQAAIDLRFTEVSAGAELSSDMLVRGLVRTEEECEDISRNVQRCTDLVNSLEAQLRTVGGEQLSSIAALAEIDVLKRRLSLCRRVLLVVQQWDIRARELELVLKGALQSVPIGLPSSSVQEETHIREKTTVFSPVVSAKSTDVQRGYRETPGGTAPPNQHLIQAVHHIVSMKEATRFLKGLPPFAPKCAWISGYEQRFLAACTVRLTDVIRDGNEDDFVQYAHIFQRLGVPDKFEEAIGRSFSCIVVQAFASLWPRTPYARATACCSDDPEVQHQALAQHTPSDDDLVVQYYQKGSALLNTCHRLLRSVCDGASRLSRALPLDFKRLVTALLSALFSTPLAALHEYMHNAVMRDFDRPSFEQQISCLITSLQVGFSIVSESDILADADRLQSGHEDGRGPGRKTPATERGRSPRVATVNSDEMLEAPEAAPNERDVSFWTAFCREKSPVLLPETLISTVSVLVSQRLAPLCGSVPSLKPSWTSQQTCEAVQKETTRTLQALALLWRTDAKPSTKPKPATAPGSPVYDPPPVVLLEHAVACPAVLVSFDVLMKKYWGNWDAMLTCFFRGGASGTDMIGSCERTETHEMGYMTEEAVRVTAAVQPDVLGLCRDLWVFLVNEAYVLLKDAIRSVWEHCRIAWDRQTPFACAGRAVARHYAPTLPGHEEIIRLLEEKKRHQDPVDRVNTVTLMDLQRMASKTMLSFLRVAAGVRQRLLMRALEPLGLVFKKYPFLPVWTAASTALTNKGDSLDPVLESSDRVPTAAVISVGEYLLSIVPFFHDIGGFEDSDCDTGVTSIVNTEKRNDTDAEASSTIQLEDLSLQSVPLEQVLEEATALFCNAVRRIQCFTPYGRNQLITDSAYLERALVALGHDPKQLHECVEELML